MAAGLFRRTQHGLCERVAGVERGVVGVTRILFDEGEDGGVSGDRVQNPSVLSPVGGTAATTRRWEGAMDGGCVAAATGRTRRGSVGVAVENACVLPLESDMVQMRIGDSIADNDTFPLLVVLVGSNIVGNRLPHRLTARTSCSKRVEVGMCRVDGMLCGHSDRTVCGTLCVVSVESSDVLVSWVHAWTSCRCPLCCVRSW